MLPEKPAPPRWYPARYLLALALCVLTALVALPLRGLLDLANNVMLFLLVVFIIAVKLGRGPAVLAAFLSVALFDLFFVPPHLSFTVVDAQYLVTFAVMLAVSLITSHLAAQLAERTETAQDRERETRRLYELASTLGAALTVDQVAEILGRFLGALEMEAALLLDTGHATEASFAIHGGLALDDVTRAQAGTAYRDNRIIAASHYLFLPFSGATRARGVLVVAHCPEQMHPLLEAVASLTGIAVERLHYAEVAQRSELDAQAEKLRSSLLSSISHDLRTPLTSLVGHADGLAERQTLTPPEIREKAAIIRDQARAMHRMVTNLLDMARLQSGRVVLHKQWQPIEDIIGSSMRLLDDVLGTHRLTIDLPDDLPLVNFDAVLMERVLCNLLENAAKYSAPAAAIRITGRSAPPHFELSVCNDGEGFPIGLLDHMFDLFTRGTPETTTPGTGIGLAVCRAIVSAHGGTLLAENLPGQACIRISLPLGTPPVLDGEAQ